MNQETKSIDYIPHLPDFLLIHWANQGWATYLVDVELERRYQEIKEELEPYEQEWV